MCVEPKHKLTLSILFVMPQKRLCIAAILLDLTPVFPLKVGFPVFNSIRYNLHVYQGREIFEVNKFSRFSRLWSNHELKLVKFNLDVECSTWHKTSTSILKYSETVRYAA